MKALYCSGCADLVGLPPARAVAPIRQCLCGRVLGRWADLRRGTALVSEFPDPFPSAALAEACELVARRDEVFKVTGEMGDAELAEFDPEWARRWAALSPELAPLADSALDAPVFSWVVSVPNQLLIGAHARTKTFPHGRAPLAAEAEFRAERHRPGMTAEAKFVPLDRLLLGAWVPVE